MVTEKVLSLLKMLRDKTVKGTLKWKQSMNGNSFETSLPNSTLSFTQDIERNIFFNIYNEDGVLLQSISDNDISGQVDGSYQFMLSLYENAKASALHVDEALDQIIDELNDI